MGVTISSWITDSAGWQTMNRMQFATFSGGWRFSELGGRWRGLLWIRGLGHGGHDQLVDHRLRRLADHEQDAVRHVLRRLEVLRARRPLAGSPMDKRSRSWGSRSARGSPTPPAGRP